jgi:hypothetical protein
LPAWPGCSLLACPHRRLQEQQREAQALSKALAGVRAETSRLNALLADAAGQHSALHEDNVLLEGRLGGELKVGARSLFAGCMGDGPMQAERCAGV